ncbi:hypothetical protein [Pseudomonas asiatica]|uniref:Uncharacterized protein n=1 Tax=Pseudomonas asiatica TaxID=2219225 RepID=A0A9X4D3F1_9PSED|nr:hypothetical protein [Pseudomonas asiatica]MDD2108857.1 hypothetical protein [Pseudomonas asiatica]
MPTETTIDCPALHQRSDSYPFGDRVPRTVRMLKTVTADPMPGIGLAYIKGDAPVAKAGQTYPVWTNSHGAVTAVMEDGTRLGLRPAEFEVDSWHHLAPEPAPQHPEPIAWMVGTAIWWTKEEAERDAAATGLPVVPVGPMTGSGDIGLAREMLRRALRREDKWASLCSGRNKQVAELRSKLANLPEKLISAIEREQERCSQEDYLMDSDDCIKVIREALVASGVPVPQDQPYQGIPGTSFQRLNALANQGE